MPKPTQAARIVALEAKVTALEAIVSAPVDTAPAQSTVKEATENVCACGAEFKHGRKVSDIAAAGSLCALKRSDGTHRIA